LEAKIRCIHGDMLNPFPKDEKFYITSAEGSIYIAGFKNSPRDYRPFMKTVGHFALTEVSLLSDAPPKKLKKFWDQ
jgi:hypothetical protein